MKTLFSTGLILILLSSCSPAVEPADLYGRWEYIKVGNADPQDTLTSGELREQSPAIIFTENKDLVIEWGDRELSRGKFKIDGKMIRYTENLKEGTTRDFPFLVLKLNADELIFQTMDRDYTIVTAVRSK